MTKWATINALSRQFELCGIEDTTQVVALAGDQDLAVLVRAALSRCRADAIEIRPIDGMVRDRSLQAHPALAAALAAAQVVVDATDPVPGEPGRELAGRQPDLGIQDGQRLVRLSGWATRAELFRPTVNLDRRCSRLADEIRSGDSLQVSDRHQVALQVDLADVRVESCGGRATEPGDAVRFPSGWVRAEPDAGSVTGELLVMPGDAVMPWGQFVRAPCRLVIEGGRLVDLEGEAGDADLLRSLFERADSLDAYLVTSLGVGMNPATAVTPEAFASHLVDPELAHLGAGTVTVGFGGSAAQPVVGLALVAKSLEIEGRTAIRTGTLWGDFAPDIYETHH